MEFGMICSHTTQDTTNKKKDKKVAEKKDDAAPKQFPHQVGCLLFPQMLPKKEYYLVNKLIGSQMKLEIVHER